MTEYLEGVRCLYNTDDTSSMLLITDRNVYNIELKFTKKELFHGYKNSFTYRYPIDIKKYCEAHDINCRDYFNMIHKEKGDKNNE